MDCPNCHTSELKELIDLADNTLADTQEWPDVKWCECCGTLTTGVHAGKDEIHIPDWLQ